MKLFTIGFTKKPAREFFEMLRNEGAKRIVDVRLNNVSQLAGFAKKNDLQYFLEEICNMDYAHIPELAPNQEILDAYKKKKGDWQVYEKKFLALMKERKIEDTLSGKIMPGDCLLCSEHEPEHCHRSLVVKYLQQHWGDMEIIHLPRPNRSPKIPSESPVQTSAKPG